MTCDYRAGRNDDMGRYSTDIGRVVRIQDSVCDANTVIPGHGWLDIAFQDYKKEQRKD